MKHILRYPATNAVCISLFSIFYGMLFLIVSRGERFTGLFYAQAANGADHPFLASWSEFLSAGYLVYLAYVMFALTILVVVLLLSRSHPYDEYHTALLVNCLAVATVLTLIAIALFYLLILIDDNGIVEKFTLFIVIHWVTVVLADMVYVILCRWK